MQRECAWYVYGRGQAQGGPTNMNIKSGKLIGLKGDHTRRLTPAYSVSSPGVNYNSARGAYATRHELDRETYYVTDRTG